MDNSCANGRRNGLRTRELLLPSASAQRGINEAPLRRSPARRISRRVGMGRVLEPRYGSGGKSAAVPLGISPLRRGLEDHIRDRRVSLPPTHSPVGAGLETAIRVTRVPSTNRGLVRANSG